jgi:hypothetical protein
LTERGLALAMEMGFDQAEAVKGIRGEVGHMRVSGIPRTIIPEKQRVIVMERHDTAGSRIAFINNSALGPGVFISGELYGQIVVQLADAALRATVVVSGSKNSVLPIIVRYAFDRR